MSNLYTGMKNGTKKELLIKYQQILNDVKENAKDLMLRYEYFTHKYRGTRLEDVNLGVWQEPGYDHTAQIFLRTRENKYIKHTLLFNYKGILLRESILSNTI